MSSKGGSSGGGSSSSSGSSSSPMPRPVKDAPKGAYLGSTSDGKKAVSLGGGNYVFVSDDSSRDTLDNYVQPASRSSTPAPVSSPTPQAFGGSAGGESSGGGGGGSVPTTVNQKPAANSEGPENTTVTSGPRSDFSVVLAGQVGRRPDRSPARSNNFVSLVGGAGGLGRRAAEAKRTLIGGA